MPLQLPEIIEISHLQAWINQGEYSSVFALVDSNTHQHCLLTLQQSLTETRDIEILEVEPGEAQKEVEIAAGLWQAMLELGGDRKSLLLCLGGGMITDLGGFIASTFKRGIDFIHIPTSLLGMVDASIGGKTGINLQANKNQIGSFAFPKCIVLHPEFLSTLPEEEKISGYAEMLKHALLESEERLGSFLTSDRLDMDLIRENILHSMQFKSHVVTNDPFEANSRKTLNLGHTCGHAFETLSHLAGLPMAHGVAVAHGMRLALKLSVSQTGLSSETAGKCDAHILSLFPPLPHFDSEALWEVMLKDKKNRDGKVLFVLLEKPGSALFDIEVEKATFQEALAQL